MRAGDLFQALLDAAGEVLASEVVEVAEAAGARQRCADRFGIGDVGEKFGDNGYAL